MGFGPDEAEEPEPVGTVGNEGELGRWFPAAAAVPGMTRNSRTRTSPTKTG